MTMYSLVAVHPVATLEKHLNAMGSAECPLLG